MTPVPAAPVASVFINIIEATGHDRYTEINSLAIELPPVPVMPSAMTGWSGINYLLSLSRQAAKWTPMPSDTQKKIDWVWKSAVQKDKDHFLLAVSTLHEFREGGKHFPPLLWCWWRMLQQIEEGYSGLHFKGIWNPKVMLDAGIRRWFYDDIDLDNITRRKIWPAEATGLLELLRKFEKEATSADSAKLLWDFKYRKLYETLRSSALESKYQAEKALKEKANKPDLGVWLSRDVIDYVGLTQVHRRLVDSGLQTSKVRRKKTT